MKSKNKFAAQKIIIITGGDTLESKSSHSSAWNIISQIKSEDFDLFLVNLDKWNWKLIWAKNYSQNLVDRSNFDLKDLTLNIANKKINFDVAFILIHGYPGESGHIQAYLEMLNIPYTGSNMLTSAIAINKYYTKKMLSSLGDILLPKTVFLDKARNFDSIDLKKISLPCIVKPNSYGSGINVALVNDHDLLFKSIKLIHNLGQDALIEQFIDGREVTVGVILIDNKLITLPAAEVFRPDFFTSLSKDKIVRFTDRQSSKIAIPAQYDEIFLNHLYDLTKKIGIALECKDFFRVDFIIDPKKNIYFLEINTIPGMTEKSVFTEQLKASSHSLKELFIKIIQRILIKNSPNSSSKLY